MYAINLDRFSFVSISIPISLPLGIFRLFPWIYPGGISGTRAGVCAPAAPSMWKVGRARGLLAVLCWGSAKYYIVQIFNVVIYLCWRDRGELWRNKEGRLTRNPHGGKRLAWSGKSSEILYLTWHSNCTNVSTHRRRAKRQLTKKKNICKIEKNTCLWWL